MRNTGITASVNTHSVLAGMFTVVRAMFRVVVVVAGLACALPAMAEEMTASEARHFVVGKLFSFNCFDGTRGMARVHDDGSVDGFIQAGGTGPTRYGAMPAGTLRADGERVCTSLPRSIMQPCFYLERTNDNGFRGTILGLSFAYCDFTLYQRHAQVKQPGQHRPLSVAADK